MRGLTSPGVSYARWFSNDQGQNPGEDPLTVWASEDDGSSWVLLEQVDSAPLQWVETTHPLPQGVRATARMRFRFIAGDLGFGGSLVEAGVDDFAVVDIGQGCVDCAAPLPTVDAILVGRSGDDVVIDWSADPSGGARFVVYRLTGTMLERGLRLGSTAARTFVHQDAALAQESFFYRVTAVDACGNESVLP